MGKVKGFFLTVLFLAAKTLTAQESDLILRLPLEKDLLVQGTENLVLEPQAITFDQFGAKFDGQKSQLRIKQNEKLNFGSESFSISTYLRTEGQLDDSIGDIASQFDLASRKGFNLSVDTRSGVTASQSNFRQLFFGIDSGDSGAPWSDEGVPAPYTKQIASMATYQGSLYIGTLDVGLPMGGRVFRYQGSGKWEDMKLPQVSTMVASLAEFQGKLCAGTMRYRWGSRLDEGGHNPSSHVAGEVYCLDPSTGRWIFAGTPDRGLRLGTDEWPPSEPSVTGMTTFQGRLMAIPQYTWGVFGWDGAKENVWRYFGTPVCADNGLPLVRALSIGTWNGRLFAALNDAGGVAVFEDGIRWKNLGLRLLQNYSFVVYQGKLHVGTFPTGEVFRLDGDIRHKDPVWTSIGRLGKESEIMALAVYNGVLYGGSLPAGEVYRYEGGTSWTKLEQLDKTPMEVGTFETSFKEGLKRVWTMSVHDGRLFAGTLPSGRVYSLGTGLTASYDHSLPAGWVHLVAVRDADSVKLYLDGKLVSQSAKTKDKFDLNNGQDLLIGMGQNDHLNGWLREFRIYRGALSESRIKELASKKPV